MSLHQKILSEVEGHILSGDWPPGYRIPFEHELTQQYGCSRMTVNKALSELVKRGLIERRRKSGSYVSFPQAQSAVMEIHEVKREVQSLGLDYAYRLGERVVRKMASGDEGRIDLPGSSRLLDINCSHFAGGRVFCLEERLINLSAVPEAETETFEAAAPGSWLLGKVPWSTAEHRIRAVAASRTTAQALEIAIGAACLVIERRTWSGGVPVTSVLLTYPGDRHELIAEFAPSATA
ncbi:histidine utilization repressor [Sinorhizobium medicae]|uniref:Histidine utilization repressor n=2 Tax=Sinorhizobium medicae TaxID=110321 RepID=A0ABX4TMX2_9HYPH|nr:histidine utilization repressor [Sinorhizobium medicae]MDX0451976.1 histidine utilization repressor [Sinorhizobium medicae]MDX0513661.1 histidine utilization repressor [Sinorhizobium medicae]MDX0520109.1 histidine utilization repressor [Sinorhizobium medicae]MDX0547311.1 histidine utilization repressor [Sinorhizobium medicae]MDX0631431.1 histidine utilization repressor [Sinorhizobium medicae]